MVIHDCKETLYPGQLQVSQEIRTHNDYDSTRPRQYQAKQNTIKEKGGRRKNPHPAEKSLAFDHC